MDNRIQDAFSHVKADPGLKETTKDFLAKKREERSRALRARAVYKTVAAACAMLLLILGFGGYQWAQTPVSYVSIDVNPSIELGLNCFERVVSAEAYNPEGEEILKGLSLKGKKYMEAINSVVGSKAMSPYLAREEELVLTVAAEGSREKEIETGVMHCSNSIGKNCHSVIADIKMAASAHNNGMSVGKYNAYLQLSQYDSEVTLDECRHMSMSQIHGLLNEHGHNEGCHDAQQESTGQEGGQEAKPQSADKECSQDAKPQSTGQEGGQDAQPQSTGNGKHQREQQGQSQGGHHRSGHHQ